MEKLKRSLLPVIIGLVGLLILISGISGAQSGLFLVGGITIMLMGGLTFLLFFDIIPPKTFRIVTFIMVPLAIVIGLFAYKSVESTIDFDAETRRRNQYVITRLIDIRTAQMFYKADKNSYAGSFEELIDYLKNGKMTVIRAVGSVHDSLLFNPQVKSLKDAELLSIERGYIIRDTMLINVLDTIVNQLASPIDSLPFIPFAAGEKFAMAADTVEQGYVKVPVFEAYAPFTSIYKGLNEVMIRNKIKDMEVKGLRVGDITKPVTTGNWE